MFWWGTSSRGLSRMSANPATAGGGSLAAVPVASPIPVVGHVTSAGCAAGPMADATITLDDRVMARTDADGRFRFDPLPTDPVAGLPTGQHVLVARAPNTRTKIVRVSSTSVDLTMHTISGPSCAGPSRPNSIDAADATVGEVVDVDQDGIDDMVEDWLAERFAPIVYHDRDEANYPVAVDWLLKRTGLHEFDTGSSTGIATEVVGALDSQTALLDRTFAGPDGQALDSAGTRSVCKRSGYFLTDVGARDRAGQRDDPRGWITYVHSYGNTNGGVTIQYWRAYAYDQTTFLFVDWGHGGDWEGIAVHLDAALQPETIGFLGHLGIERRPAREVQWEGTHPRVLSEPGGHASRNAPADLRSSKFTRQETWTGGEVRWWDDRRDAGGGLLNVGEKRRPRNGQRFIQYSGLWGSPHRWFSTSGYWGPAFNETGALCEDGRAAYRLSLGCGARSDCSRIFHTAWCAGMDGGLLALDNECYAVRSSP